MQKKIDTLTTLAKLRHDSTQRIFTEVNVATDKDDRDVLIREYHAESDKYTETVRDLCREILQAEAISEEECPVDRITAVADHAVNQRYSKQRIYKAVVDAIDFTFMKVV